MALSKYLTGYLSILPASQREVVLQYIKEEKPEIYSGVTYAQYAALVRQIAEDRALSTELVSQPEVTDSETHNRFFSSVYSDLQIIFNEIGLIEVAINNYETVANSELAELESELNLLLSGIRDLENSLAQKENSICITEAFNNTQSFEVYNESTKRMFLDRDGSVLDVVTVISKDDSYIQLKQETEEIETYGFTTSIVKQLGSGSDQSGHTIDKVVDDNINSSWIYNVVSGTKLNGQLDQFKAPGAMCLLKVKFKKVEQLNTITCVLDGAHPLRIEAIYYIKDNKTYYITTSSYFSNVTGKKGIVSYDPPDNNYTRTYNFPTIYAGELYFFLRQENYELATVKETWLYYTVKKGDCMWHIAKHFGVKWREIWNLNKKVLRYPDNPNLIYPGQVFRIKKLTDGVTVNYKTYTVQKGDTLQKIANKFTILKEYLMDINNIHNDNEIQVGEVLKVKPI